MPIRVPVRVHRRALGLGISSITLALAASFAQPAHADPPGPIGASAQPPSTVDAPSPSLERITFPEALRRALARNPSAAIAEAEVRRAAAILEQVRAGSLPTLSVNATYTRLDADRELNGRIIAGANQLAANVLLTVPLVVPQRWAQWSHAGEVVDIARANRADVQRTIAANVAHAYISVASQHRIIATLERARDNARAHFDYAHTRFTGGIGNRLDEVRAAQDAALSGQQVATQRLVLSRQQAALGILLGLDHPIDAVEDANVDGLPNQANALSQADQRRADIQSQQRRLRAAEHVRNDSWVDYLPNLFGTFQPFYQNPPTLTQPETGWQAQLILSVPLYDGGYRYGARHERDAIADEARINLEGLRAQVRTEVRAAFESLRQAEASATAAHESAMLATEARELAEQAYRVGATSNLELIDAQRRERDAQSQSNAADDSVRQTRIDLLLAAGAFP